MKTDLIEPREVKPAPAPAGTVAPRLVGILQRRPSLVKAALSVFDQGIYSATSFLTAVIVGRATGQSELGIYYLTLTIVMVMFGIQETVVAGPYAIFSARRRGLELAEYTGSMWAHHLALTAVGMAAIFVIIGVSALTGAVDFMAGLWVLLVAGPVMLMREGIRRFSFARLRLISAIALDLTVSLLQLTALASLWYFGRLSVPAIFGVMGGACAVACLGWFTLTTDPPRFVRSRFYDDWRHNWGFAKWVVLSWLIVDTVPFVMPWIVDFAAGSAATGLYGACATLVGVNNILVVGTGNFLRPKSAQLYATSGVIALRTLLLTTGALFVVVFGTFTVGMVLFGDWLAVFVYGESFRGSWKLLTTLAANLLVCSLGFIGATGLWAVGKPRASMFADLCLAVTTIVAGLFLVGPYGALGAAMAALIGSIIGTTAKVTTLVWLLRSLAADSNSLVTEEPVAS